MSAADHANIVNWLKRRGIASPSQKAIQGYIRFRELCRNGTFSMDYQLEVSNRSGDKLKFTMENMRPSDPAPWARKPE